eukprot:gene3197-5926_t
MSGGIASVFHSKQGSRLDARKWLPEDLSKAKALIFLAHGYAHHIDAFQNKVGAQALMEQGFCVFGVSHLGHGNSDGLRALVKDYHDLINDFVEYIQAMHRELEEKGVSLPCFIIGQSMGGAIALLASSPNSPVRSLLKGVILLAPMCKIADEMMLPDWIINAMYWSAFIIPWAPITPVEPTERLCFKDPKALEESMRDPLGYHSRPRLMTAYQMLQMIKEVQRLIPQYEAPFLVLHGKADVVTSPQASQDLHDQSVSEDKSIVLFDDMWHAMLSEPDPNPQLVRNTFISWILERC